MRVEKKVESYTGIDVFRLVAAVLIITIHTSPLVGLSETGDFILTRIVARVAVPCFCEKDIADLRRCDRALYPGQSLQWLF